MVRGNGRKLLLQLQFSRTLLVITVTVIVQIEQVIFSNFDKGRVLVLGSVSHNIDRTPLGSLR
jgi:hypothetical protein